MVRSVVVLLFCCACLVLACSKGSQRDRNIAPPAPQAGAAADLNGTWRCVGTRQVEGVTEVFVVDDRLRIEGNVLVELSRPPHSTRSLDFRGRLHSSNFWFQNQASAIGFVWGWCGSVYVKRRTFETCEGWRFSLDANDQLVGYAAKGNSNSPEPHTVQWAVWQREN